LNFIQHVIFEVANKEQKIQMLNDEIKSLESLSRYHHNIADQYDFEVEKLRSKIQKLERS